jgi:hypothetical protein
MFGKNKKVKDLEGIGSRKVSATNVHYDYI